MTQLKVRIWTERSDIMDCWLWRYVATDGTWTTPTGTALRWHDARVAAELLLYAQHHARPVAEPVSA